MPSPRSLISGFVSRLLPPASVDDADSNDRPIRLGRWRDVRVESAIHKHHLLADEGSYWITHNAQTGVISSLLGTTFSHTTLSPYLIIGNTDNPGGKSISLDYVHLVCTAAGAAASGLTNMIFAWSLDQIQRWASGGTDLTGGPASGGGTFSPNSGIAKRASVSQVNIGALTLNAASANARLIVPQRQMRQLNAATALGAVQDHYFMNFGGAENSLESEVDISTAKTNALEKPFALPPLIIAPQHCAILHLWSPGAALTTGISFLPEIGGWER